MKSADVKIQVGGGSMPCYLARPEGSAKGTVIIFQEIFGVNTEVKRIADLVASVGYVGIAPNYYHRTHPTLNAPYSQEGMQQGFAAAGAIGRATLKADIEATVNWLKNEKLADAGKIVTWGFCLGGSVAFLSATMPGIAGAICFYGGQIAGGMPNGEPPMINDVADIRAPLLLAFGDQDDFIPADAVRAIEASLKGAGKAHEVVVYPGVGHAFFRESSAALNSTVVSNAWTTVQSFLSRILG